MVEVLTGWAPVFLRIAIGLIFILHGYPKLNKNLKKTSEFLNSIGFRPGKFWALVLGSVEFFGGLAILIGLFTRTASVLLGIIMIIALYYHTVVWKKKFIGGYELDFLILFALISLLLLGSGNLSIGIPFV
jgi:putative oxidoreductase